MKFFSLLGLLFLSLSCSHKSETTHSESSEKTSAAIEEQSTDNVLEELDDLSELDNSPELAPIAVDEAPTSVVVDVPKQELAPPAQNNMSTGNKGFFAKTLYACPAHSEASSKSPKIRTIPSGRKVWAEMSGKNWYKIFLKSTHAFVQSNCLKK
jgi:hypothetical protein